MIVIGIHFLYLPSLGTLTRTSIVIRTTPAIPLVLQRLCKGIILAPVGVTLASYISIHVRIQALSFYYNHAEIH